MKMPVHRLTNFESMRLAHEEPLSVDSTDWVLKRLNHIGCGHTPAIYFNGFSDSSCQLAGGKAASPFATVQNIRQILGAIRNRAGTAAIR